MEKKFSIKQITPQHLETWAIGEIFYWTPEINDILKKDTDNVLFTAAYHSVNWESYYELLNGTPFYDWAVENDAILSFGGPFHIERNCFFSEWGDMSVIEGDWLREHPDFNPVLHNIHVETVEQMIDYMLCHTAKLGKI
ncbi:MAG: hypothetical protein GY862_18930 [Gammaproteobacteria bacterium]|nr:hypothetical protein [Gammaproteobacteria bacterium]